MVVIGIDPGTRKTGYAVVESGPNGVCILGVGAIATSPHQRFHEKLLTIYRGLGQIVARFRPEEMAVEDVFVKENAGVALKMGHTRGVVLLVGALNNIPIGEYSPREIKQAIVGSGSASKEQVKFMVSALLSLTEVPSEDEADALAVALCHLHKRRTSEDSPLDILHKRHSC